MITLNFVCMGRRSRSDIEFLDKSLAQLIKIFCTNVKTIRQSKNLTQQELATKSYLAVNTIAEIEQHRIENLRLSTITALGNAFKIHPIDLLKKNEKTKKT